VKIMFAAMGSEVISLESLSAVLKQHGYTCRLAFDRGLFDDKQYFSIPFLARLFNDRAQVLKEIRDFKPDILAFSVMTDTFQWCLDIARAAKKQAALTVVMGGVHPSCVPEVCIAQDCVDVVCTGEGEYPLLELAQSMAAGRIDYGIRNLWFKKDGQVIKNPPRPLIQDLDTLPMPDKDLFEEYIDIPSYYLTVTNKGCIARCAYCSQNFYESWGREQGLAPFYRERSVDSVIAELRHMQQRYHFKRVDIKNNVLAARKEWTLAFAERYKAEIGVPLRIMGHPKTIDAEVAVKLKEAGCWHVQIGIESMNPAIRRNWLGRNETNQDIACALEAMDKAGLHYSVDLMVGLPGETNEDILEALEFLIARPALTRASIFWLKYLPAVEITRHALECSQIGPGDLEKINQGLQPNYLSTGSVEDKAMRGCLLSFQVLFRILPIMPRGLMELILRRKYYRYFRYLPQIPVIIFIDILVSICKKDHWALYAIYSYLWELGRRARRFVALLEKS